MIFKKNPTTSSMPIAIGKLFGKKTKEHLGQRAPFLYEYVCTLYTVQYCTIECLCPLEHVNSNKYEYTVA